MVLFQLFLGKVDIGGSHLGSPIPVTYVMVDVACERKVLLGKDKLSEGNQKLSGGEIIWSPERQ